ncbi:MAG TPA: Lpg1974 family pore-forming outer membrane protein [Gemmataceae bacterium]|nr:Lpg1974 family pore-forming outer membrane protein [Gemmataceae bacterium]
MTARWVLAVGLALAAPACGARAQECLVPLPDGLGGTRAVDGQFGLLPTDTRVISTTPLFLADPAGGAVRATATGAVVATGAGGQLFAGFDYLRPFWSARDFTRPVPPGYESAFPVVADIGHIDSHFTFVPRVQYDYDIPGMDFDVGAAATFLGLSGRYQRDVAATGASAGDVVATYDLTLVSVIPVQAARRFAPGELGGYEKAGSLIDASVGTRYVALDQDYASAAHAAVGGGVNVATRTTSQSFRGFGITAALGWQVPVGDDLAAYLGARGSVLIGDNERSSTATVIAVGRPAFSEAISEARTLVVPVVEMEAGLAWGTELGHRLAVGDPAPELCVRVSLVGQYWGGMGPLSAGSPQGFRTSDLCLAGVSVQLGLRH